MIIFVSVLYQTNYMIIFPSVVYQTSGYFDVWWIDESLMWTTSDYNGLDTIYVVSIMSNTCFRNICVFCAVLCVCFCTGNLVMVPLTWPFYIFYTILSLNISLFIIFVEKNAWVVRVNVNIIITIFNICNGPWTV